MGAKKSDKLVKKVIDLRRTLEYYYLTVKQQQTKKEKKLLCLLSQSKTSTKDMISP